MIVAGHALRGRECWGQEDLNHPSEAGYAAIASALTSAIEAGRSPPRLARAPACSSL